MFRCQIRILSEWERVTENWFLVLWFQLVECLCLGWRAPTLQRIRRSWHAVLAACPWRKRTNRWESTPPAPGAWPAPSSWAPAPGVRGACPPRPPAKLPACPALRPVEHGANNRQILVHLLFTCFDPDIEIVDLCFYSLLEMLMCE